MFLSPRCSDLGVLAHTESTSPSAYLLAALRVKAMQKGNPSFLPFSGPSRGLLQDTYAVLQAAHSDLPALSLEAVVKFRVCRHRSGVHMTKPCCRHRKQCSRNSATLRQLQSASGVNGILPGCTGSWTVVHPNSWMQCPWSF